LWFSLHRELLACESSLVHLYCRQSVLKLSNPQELCLEILPIEPHLHHLNMLCCSHFAEPLPDCVTISDNVNLACDPKHALLAVQGSLLDKFFHSASDFLEHLNSMMDRFGEARQLVLLTERLLHCLHNAPKQFGHLEVKLGETKENTDIYFPSAAFLYVSCLAKEPPSVSSKQSWVQVFCYKGGQGKAGRQQLQEVVQYPSESSPHFPTVLLPFDRVHVKILGVSASSNTSIVFHALSPDLLLALAYSMVLSQVKTTSEQLTQCLQVCFSRWEHFLKRYDAPDPLKQAVFHLLCQLSCVEPSIRASSDFITNLQSELKQLYEKEVTFFQSSGGASKGKTKALLSFPPKDSLTCGGTGRFSNYLQSLLELYLTINRDHYQEKADAESKKKPGKVKKSTSTSKDEIKDWLNKVAQVVESLLPLGSTGSSNNYCDQALAGSLPVKIHNRLLVVTGLPTSVPCEEIQAAIKKVTSFHGGLYNNELHLPSEKRAIPPTPSDEVESLSGLLGGEKDKEKESKETSKKEDGEAPAASGVVVKPASDPKGDAASDKKEKSKNDRSGDKQTDKQVDKKVDKQADKQVDVSLGYAILEVNSSVKLQPIKSSMLSNPLLQVEGGDLAVHTVSDQLQCSSNSHNHILHDYLRDKLSSSQNCLHSSVNQLFSSVFHSCAKGLLSTDNIKEASTGVSKANLCDNSPCNLLKRFLNGYRGKTILADVLTEMYGEQAAQDSQLSLEKFLEWVSSRCWDNVVQVWSGLLAIGYNLHFER